MFFVCPINDNLYVIILATGIASGTFSHPNDVVFATEARQLMVNCKERPVFLAPLSWRGKSCVHGRDVVSFCTFSFTGPARQPFRLPSPYPPYIREIPQNYNNYIQAFREKDGIHGHEVRNCLTRRTVRQLPVAYRHFLGKPESLYFLSPLVIAPPCHFDRGAGKRENLIETGQSF
jgi:hypothetical protein